MNNLPRTIYTEALHNTHGQGEEAMIEYIIHTVKEQCTNIIWSTVNEHEADVAVTTIEKYFK